MRSYRVERQVLQPDTGRYALVSMYINAMSGSDAGWAADLHKYQQDETNVAAFEKAHKGHRRGRCPAQLEATCNNGEPTFYNPEMP